VLLTTSTAGLSTLPVLAGATNDGAPAPLAANPVTLCPQDVAGGFISIRAELRWALSG
jgi:hypothetical protein